MKDPIVEEVRKYRMEHTKKFGGDLKAICEDLRRIQKESGLKVVRLRARRVSVSPQTESPRTKKSNE